MQQVTAFETDAGRPAWKHDLTGGIRAVAAGAGVVAIAADGGIEFLDAATGKHRGDAAIRSMPVAIVAAPDGRRFWVAAHGGEIVEVVPPSVPK